MPSQHAPTVGPRLAFIVGAPRSGTTWLQRSLASHPHVASPQETHLFGEYLKPLYTRWESDQLRLESVLERTSSGDDPAFRTIGLSTILEKDDLDEAAHCLIDAVVRRCVAVKPAAHVVLEKTPSNAGRIAFIESLVPDGRFIHVIRDPRDVVASLLAARREMGWTWAPRDAAGAARLWRTHVSAARAAATDPSRHLEVRYERLREDTAPQLARVADFLGLDGGHPLSSDDARLVMRAEVRSRLGDTDVEPAGFSGGGRPRHHLSVTERLAVERQAGGLLQELGYADSSRWPAVPLRGRAAAAPALVGRELARTGRRAFRSRFSRRQP